MGDRRNVIIKAESENFGIALYTHWTGSEILPEIALGLERGKSRWDDAGYFTRIMFDQITRHEGKDETTGFGIYPLTSDGQSPMEPFPGYDPVIDLDDGSVELDGKSYPFNKFICTFLPDD